MIFFDNVNLCLMSITNRKILVVDDDEDIAYVVTTLLEMNGFVCDYITDPRQLDDKISGYHPNVVLLDIALGNGFDGRGLSKRLKENDEGLKVILFSANNDISLNYKAFGANGSIHKPFEVESLLKIISD